ncbi:MAG: hypothetical protein NTZ27_02710 [Ignavibacteriales bacterium]|nr:hypothetical protein [Ignavibacteriales bacterium]
MKNLILSSVFIFIFSLLFINCNNPNSIEGKSNQWLKGQTISTKVTYEKYGFVVLLHNETAKDFNLINVKITYYDKNKNEMFINLSGLNNIWLESGKYFEFPRYGTGEETIIKVSILQNDKTIEIFSVTF